MTTQLHGQGDTTRAGDHANEGSCSNAFGDGLPPLPEFGLCDYASDLSGTLSNSRHFTQTNVVHDYKMYTQMKMKNLLPLVHRTS